MHTDVMLWAAAALVFAGVLLLQARPRKAKPPAEAARLSLLSSDVRAGALSPSLIYEGALAPTLAAKTVTPAAASRRSAEFAALINARKHAQARPAELTDDQWVALMQLADKDPKAALARIDALPASDRRNPLVRFVRIFAFGHLIWPRGEIEDVARILRSLSSEQIRHAEEAVGEVAAIERDAPGFFDQDITMHEANRVCVAFEYHRPGGVQQTLGWTKLFYWFFTDGRFLNLDPSDPDTEDLKNLPRAVLARLMDIRFTSHRIVVSSVLAAARRTTAGWMAGVVLCSKTGGATGKVADLEPFGFLTLREDGTWHLSQKPSADAEGLTFAAVGDQHTQLAASVERLNAQMDRVVEELRAISRKLDR